MNGLEKKTILFVEDDAVLATTIAKILDAFGYEIVIANSGEEAIEIFHSTHGIHLILMDINLGDGIDGAQTAKIILKENEVPIVFLSNHTEPEIIEKMENVTPYGFIIKNSSSTILNASLKMAFRLFEKEQKMIKAKNRLESTLDALQENEKRYLSIIEDQTEMICRYLPNGKITFVNDAYIRYFEKKRRDIINNNFIPNIPENDLRMINENLKKISQTSPIVEFEHQVIMPDNTIRWQHWTHRGIYSNDGNIAEFQAVGMDITVRKLAEDKIKILLEEKEHILKEVHHRIKNNISSVSSFLFLQTLKLDDPRAVEVLQDSQSRLQSMMLLYDKLYLSADFTSMSIREYLTPLVMNIILNFPNSNIVKVEQKISDIVLDERRLSSVGILINELLTNAMKHAFQGRDEGEILVTASQDRDKVFITVQDNGVGIPQEINIKNSTGFGLELVGMLTKKLKGDIRIERNDGTKFILEFEK